MTIEINDKRRIDENGEAKETTHTLQEQMAKLLTEIPCVYSDPRPRKNHVLIRQNAAETYYGGTRFVIPDIAREAPNVGVVVSVGANVDPKEDCKPGDLVTFGRFNAEPISVDGEDYQLVRVEDIKLVQEVTYAVASN